MNISKLDILKNSRLAMGLALFIIALTAASLISKEANRTVLVWASTGELAPGQIIAQLNYLPFLNGGVKAVGIFGLIVLVSPEYFDPPLVESI